MIKKKKKIRGVRSQTNETKSLKYQETQCSGQSPPPGPPSLLNQAAVTMAVQTNLAAVPSLSSPSQNSTLSFPPRLRMDLPETGSEKDSKEGWITIQGSHKTPLNSVSKPMLLCQFVSIKWTFHNDKDGNEIYRKVSSLGSLQISSCEGITKLI